MAGCSAMMQIMDAHIFRRFCDTITPFLQCARIEKIQEAADNVLVLTCYARGNRRHICLRHGRRDPFIFSTDKRIAGLPRPSAQVMLLRKHAQDRPIAVVVPQFCRRRLWLMPAQGQQQKRTPWLCLDLVSGPGLRFLEPGEIPEPDSPAWPEPAILTKAIADWRSWPVLCPALRRSLAHMDYGDQWALVEDLKMGGGDIFLYHSPESGSDIVMVSAWPLPKAQAGNLVEQEYSDVQMALELAGRSIVLNAMACLRDSIGLLPVRRRLRRLDNLLARLDDDEIRLKAMLELKNDALALQENLWRWPDHAGGGSVSVPAGAHGPERDMELAHGETPAARMARLFHSAGRGSRGMAHLRQRRLELESEAAALRSILGEDATPGQGHAQNAFPAGQMAAMSVKLPKNVQMFISSDGFALMRGRDAHGNMAARKLASPHDIWLHVENGPGSHVIIRRSHSAQDVPERTLEEAGCLAASKSWMSAAGSARVIYAEVRHVKPMRNAPAGTMRIDKVFSSREVKIDLDLEKRLVPQHVVQ